MRRVFVKQKQYPEAIQQLKKTLLLALRIVFARLNLAQAYVQYNSLQATVAELKTRGEKNVLKIKILDGAEVKSKIILLPSPDKI